MQRCLLLVFLVSGIFFNAKIALAQTNDPKEDSDLDQIEAEVKKSEIMPAPAASLVPAPGPRETLQLPGGETKAATPEAAALPPVPEKKIERLQDLSRLQPFSEVSVLQRRYMPKSGRVQLFAGFTDMVNDPWNATTGLNLRAAYGITEAWGIEVADFLMGSTPSQSAQNLLSQNNVNAQSFGTTSGFIGAYVQWTPIYGKMTFGTKKIVPFDMYFNAGMGNTTLSGSTTSSVSGISMAMGQIYAITRSVGFRWDLTWNAYTLPTGSTNNILLTLGANWYWPEATYR